MTPANSLLGASLRFSKELPWTGPNLTSSQLIVHAGTPRDVRTLPAEVTTLAARLHARQVLPLDTAVSARRQPGPGPSATLVQAGSLGDNFSGTVYVATPALLASYRIRPSQIGRRTGILTMRPGLASVPGMQLTTCSSPPPGTTSCPAAASISDPVIQAFSSLPSGTSAPNTVITMHAVRALHARTLLTGWLLRAARPLTAVQLSSARSAAAAAGGTLETKSGELGLTQITSGATAAGILIALGVLAMSVGLIRSESTSDLRTLTATGASSLTRRTITSTTAGALALLGATLGSAAAFAAVIAWAPGSIGAMLALVPWNDVLLILAGLPLSAAAAGWLLAGRQPRIISRQALE